MQFRKVAVGLVVISALATLTGCGAGQDAASRNIKVVTDGAETDVLTNTSDLKLRGFVVVAQPKGAGVIVGTIINSGIAEDELLGISINNVLAKLTTESSIILQKRPMVFEGDSANAKAVIPELTVKVGNTVQLSFFFRDAGIVTVRAIIRDQRDDYAGVTA